MFLDLKYKNAWTCMDYVNVNANIFSLKNYSS